LNSSPNIFKVNEWRRMGWVDHIARIGERLIKCYSEILKGRDHLGKVLIGRFLILKWLIQKQDGGVWGLFHGAQVRELWWSLVNTVMNHRVP
jgi:hypothetical protein